MRKSRSTAFRICVTYRGPDDFWPSYRHSKSADGGKSGSVPEIMRCSKKKSRTQFSGICVLVSLVFVFFWRFQHSPIVKTLNLNVWTLPLIFLHDFTLFVIDMHQNRSVSLFSTPFDHFHFHALAALK